MNHPTVIQVKDASKRFVIRKDKSLKERLVNLGRSNAHKDDFWALKNIDLEIEAGSTVGLIGPNGSGKSTLLSLIGGILQPTSGMVMHRGRLAALLELGAGFHPDLTGRENVYLNASILGLSVAQTDQFFDQIVAFSGIEPFIDTQVKFYSSGMYVRLAFAVAVHVDPDVLLVDEVLAVGDEPFQRKCMDRIREFQTEGRTIVVVTHSLDQVAELCDRAVVLEHGEIQVDDVPLAALRHLRAEFDLQRQDEIARERAATTIDSQAPRPDGRVTAARITDDWGNPVSVIKPGQGVQVTVDVHVDVPVPEPVVGISVDSVLGQVVYGTNTNLLGVTLPPLVRDSSFTFRLPELRLGEGQYVVVAALGRENGIEIHRLMDAATLSVHADGTGVGFVNIATEFMPSPMRGGQFAAVQSPGVSATDPLETPAVRAEAGRSALQP